MGLAQGGNRAEDKDFWARSALLAERYKLLVWLGIALLVSLGFGFKTPKMYYAEVESKVTKIESRVEVIESVHMNLEDKIDVLLKFRCMDSNVSDRERQIAGLQCDTPTPQVIP